MPRRGDTGDSRDEGGRVPFWAHQLAELLLGVVLLFEGARSNSHPVVLVAGIALILFTLVTDGPLSAWPRLPRRVHRIGDFVVAGVLAVAPFLFDVAVAAVVLLEAAALVMVWLALRSDFRTPVKRSWWGRSSAAPTTPAESVAATRPEPEPAAPVTSPAEPGARSLGRAAGRLRRGGVRAVGRAVGKANAERTGELKPPE